ncbi:hypothetical protein DVH24_008922 [Malus domestica]|uniref:Uncharacterized protein n=1 Tax=Malus domestica TaxID=3750 RepID=A0A498JL12_MALDO|nr:hypothetical protein DVH24_008922 [Malus domestica]
MDIKMIIVDLIFGQLGQITANKSILSLCVEMDSAIVVNLINSVTIPTFILLLTSLISAENYELVDVNREKNFVIDDLANWSYNMNLKYHYFENPSE